jgi:hypothetical protein
VQDMNPEARSLLQLARQAQTPTAEDKARVRAAIGLTVAAAVPTGAAIAVAKAGGVAGLFAGFRVALPAILVASVSVGGGAYYWYTMSPRATRHVEVKSAPPAFERPVALPTTEVAPKLAPEVSAPPPVSPSVGEVRPAATAPSQDPLLAEVTLLRRAQHAWQSGKPQLALELAQQHARAYPHSQLAVERDAVRVFAFCALGRTLEARTLASDVLARAPGSPLRASIEESCAGGPLK